jgi:DNA replication protein DnaC
MKNSDKIIQTARLICHDFKLMESQEEYYEKLFNYFTQSDSSELDINKGLLITGSVGIGKTLSLKIMQRLSRGFRIVHARHIVREYLTEGVKVIDRYGRRSFSETSNGNIDMKKPLSVCFDDILLEETNQKHYGNEQNIIAEIFLDRYDMFIDYKMMTYATTNGNAQIIEDVYGTRVRDRIREMCNIVSLTGKSLRK